MICDDLLGLWGCWRPKTSEDLNLMEFKEFSLTSIWLKNWPQQPQRLFWGHKEAVWKSCEQNSREFEPFSKHKNPAYDRHFNCLFISRANSEIVQFSRVVTELVAFKSICPFWQPDKLLSGELLRRQFSRKMLLLVMFDYEEAHYLTGWWKKGLIDKSEE